MPGSALESLFLRARDLDLAAARWCAVAVAGLAVFHVAVLTPFVDSADRRAAASSDLDRVTQAEAGLADLASELERPPAVVDEVMLGALDVLASDLDGDLARLAATHRSLRDFVASQRSGQPAAPAGEPYEAEPFHVENIDRILAIGDASTREDLLAALEPLVEQRITGPRFMDLNELWKSTARPRIEAGLDAVAARVTELRGRATAQDPQGDAAAPWEALAEALVSERRVVRGLVWAPPERPGWWASDPGADAPDEIVALALDPVVAQQLRQPLALDQLRVAFARTQTAFSDLTAVISQRRAELDRGLGAGGAAGFMESLGSDRIAGAFPLVLGLVLAACFAAGARRRRELGFLTHLLTEDGKAPRLREWYSMTFAASSPRLVSLALAALAWIALAAAQLWGLQPVRRLAIVTAVGILALLAAVAHALTVEGAIRRLMAAPRVTRDREPPPVEDDETLDWDQLRR